jgi:putative transcriptional regulator
MAIHCKLSTILGEKRLKMSDVVRETKLAKGTVHTLYHDRVQKVDYRVLDKLCSFLNCQPGDLLIFQPNDDKIESK